MVNFLHTQSQDPLTIPWSLWLAAIVEGRSVGNAHVHAGSELNVQAAWMTADLQMSEMCLWGMLAGVGAANTALHGSGHHRKSGSADNYAATVLGQGMWLLAKAPVNSIHHLFSLAKPSSVACALSLPSWRLWEPCSLCPLSLRYVDFEDVRM
jgi:hypothetical protein